MTDNGGTPKPNSNTYNSSNTYNGSNAYNGGATQNAGTVLNQTLGVVQTDGASLVTGETNSEAMASVLYQQTTQGFRDRENNAVYDTHMRTINTISTLMLVTNDRFARDDADIYDKIMESSGLDASNISPASGTPLHTLWERGTFGDAQSADKLANAISMGVFEDNQGNIVDMSAIMAKNPTIGRQLVENLSKGDLSTLASGGTFTMNPAANGKIDFQGTLDSLKGPIHFRAASDSGIRQAAVNHQNRLQNLDNFINAGGSIKAKQEAIRAVRRGSLEYVRRLDPKLAVYDGTEESYRKLMEDSSLSDELKQKLSNNHDMVGANGEPGFHDKYQARGKMLVQRYYLGTSITQGVNTYLTAGRLSRQAGRIGQDVYFEAGKTYHKMASQHALTAAKEAAARGDSLALANFSERQKKHEEAFKNLTEKQEFTHSRRKATRKQRREMDRNHRAAKRDLSDKKLDGKLNKALADGDTNKAAKYRRQKESRKKQRDKATTVEKRYHEITGKITAPFKEFKDRISEKFNDSFVGKVWNGCKSILGEMLQGSKNLLDTLMKPLRNLKKKIGKLLAKVAPVLLGGILLYGVGSALIVMFTTLLSMFTSAFVQGAGRFANALNNINYVQLIVNDASEELEVSYLETAQDDARLYFSKAGNAVPSNRIDWTAAVGKAALGEFEDEYGQPMSGISNLMQLASIMHYHMQDELTYKDYYTAEAYLYYLWIQTHHVGSNVGNHPQYEYNATDFTCVNLDECNNVYFHDYNSSMSLSLNEAAARARGVISKLFHSTDGTSNDHSSDDITTMYDAVTIPAAAYTGTNHSYDSMKDDCLKGREPANFRGCVKNSNGSHTHTYLCDRLTCNEYDGRDINGDGTADIALKLRPESVSGCPQYEHSHVDSCYPTKPNYAAGANCKKEEHSHDQTCYQSKLFLCGYSANYRGKAHTHSAACHVSPVPLCGHTQHTHNGDCYPQMPDRSKAPICGKVGHTHVHATDAEHLGCYQAKFVCGGHCGGHVTPVINLWTDTDWENIVRYDYIQLDDTHWLNEKDFELSWLHDLMVRDLDDWYNEWAKKIRGWFNPIPRVRDVAIACYRSGNQGFRALVGWLTKTGQESVPLDMTVQDKYGFTGWFNPDGTMIEGYYGDLTSLYGTRETNFQEGFQNWEELGEVIFPTNGTMPVTGFQQSQILEWLDNRYTLSAKERSIITAAMNGCGKFIYSLEKPQSGHATSGLIDCSGFVASRYYAAGIGWDNPDWTASSFAKNGVAWNGSYSSLRPGDAIAKNANSYYNGQKWVGGGANHVVIFLGDFEAGKCPYEGCDSSGYYVIDCSSSTGGASIRKLDISHYERRYRP